MANSNLSNAKNKKFDEFYTLYQDIEREMQAYLEYDPDIFRNKVVLMPCDDPEWSNFTKYFAPHFEELGLSKLISTSFAQKSKNYKNDWQPTLFETSNPIYDADKSKVCGKIFTLDHDKNADGQVNIDDLEWTYLRGTGDFRSKEVTALRDEADIIVTVQTQEAKALHKSNCPLCAIGNGSNCEKIYRINEMGADHVTAWSKGVNSSKMLCKTHNRAKGNK